ncbi:MAG: hypothetical protein RIS29_1818 [Bacteroidota bacterium]
MDYQLQTALVFSPSYASLNLNYPLPTNLDEREIMKIKTQIFLYVLLCAIGVSAQRHESYTPICTVNTNGWKKIPTIPVDMRCIVAYVQNTEKNRIKYFVNSDFRIDIFTRLQNHKSKCKHKHSFDYLDLEKYNLFFIEYGHGDACDMTMNYSLYDDSNERPALIVDVLIPESRCKATFFLIKCFLVLKSDCPVKPKVCLMNHLVGVSNR